MATTGALLVLVGVVAGHIWLPEVVPWVQNVVESLIVPLLGLDIESIAG
jgi:hypothetical protein